MRSQVVIPMRVISQEMLKLPVLDKNLKITNSRLQPHLPGPMSSSLKYQRSSPLFEKKINDNISSQVMPVDHSDHSNLKGRNLHRLPWCLSTTTIIRVPKIQRLHGGSWLRLKELWEYPIMLVLHVLVTKIIIGTDTMMNIWHHVVI